MFELSPVGIPIAIIGIVFLFFISPRILPGRTAPVCELDETKLNQYIAELIVSRNSHLIGDEHIIEHAREQLGARVSLKCFGMEISLILSEVRLPSNKRISFWLRALRKILFHA